MRAMRILAVLLAVTVVATGCGSSDDQAVDAGAHEAAEGVLGRAHDGLAPDVEGRVDQDGTARLLFERPEDLVEAWVALFVDGLDAG